MSSDEKFPLATKDQLRALENLHDEFVRSAQTIRNWVHQADRRRRIFLGSGLARSFTFSDVVRGSMRKGKRMARWICVVTMCALALATTSAAQSGTDEDDSATLSRLASWVPPGTDTYGNSYARGIEIILNYLGHDVDYDTIMGDSGQAFIVQGEVNSVNTVDGAVNIGWWPLDPMGINIRLDFLEKTVGRELREVVPTYDANGGAAYYDDPVRFYQRWFEPMVTSSLANGRPCIVQVSLWFVVTAVDDGESKGISIPARKWSISNPQRIGSYKRDC